MRTGTDTSATRTDIHTTTGNINSNPNNTLVSTNKHTHPLSITHRDTDSGPEPSYG